MFWIALTAITFGAWAACLAVLDFQKNPKADFKDLGVDVLMALGSAAAVVCGLHIIFV